MAEDGKKMSKRHRNYTPPDELMETYGADALRLYLINSGLVKAEEQRFSDAGVKEMVRKALLPWYNSFKFFQTYAQVDRWNAQTHFKLYDNILDKWILSKLQSLKLKIASEMEGYRLYNVVPSLFQFIEDLTNTYIRLNRARFWGEGLGQDKCGAYSALYSSLMDLAKIMAPFAPFLSEHLYLELSKFQGEQGQSVHLCDYPLADKKLISEKLEDATDRMQQVILLGRQKRSKEQIKIKIPLNKLTIIHKDAGVLAEIKKLESYIQQELNIKTIQYAQDESDYIKLYAKPNYPVLGKRLGKNFNSFKKLIEDMTPSQLEELEMRGSISLDGESFSSEEIMLFREAKEGTSAISNRFISIDLNCTLDQDLIEEGLAREIVNRIQKSRKDLNFNVADRIMVLYSGDPELEKAISRHQDYICGETLAKSLEKSQKLGPLNYDIDDYKISLEITRT
jgi:isoleucyl-tRNA synthetase